MQHDSSDSASITLSEPGIQFDIASVENRLALLEWRDAQLEAISSQLEAAFPKLTTTINTHIAEMTSFQVGKAHVNPRTLAETLITPWAEEQSHIAILRAETSLSNLVSSLDLDSGTRGHLDVALPALAGVGMLAASVLGLPAIVTYATVTTTSFLVVSTSSISLPLLLAGGTVLAGLSFAGVKTFDRAKDKLRANLADRVHGVILAAVFGYGLAPDARCLVNDLQAAALKAAEAELKSVI